MNVASLLKGIAKPGPDHSALAAAKDDHRQKLQALAGAQEILAHLRSKVDEADDAIRAAANAQRTLSEFRTATARNGWRYSDVLELQRLEDQAAEKSKAAQRATVNSDAIRRELPSAEHAVESAEREVKDAEERIRDEVDLILVHEFDATVGLAEGERLAAKYQAWLVQHRGLHTILRGTEADRLMQGALDRARSQIKPIEDFAATRAGSLISRPPDEVVHLTQSWRERGEVLRADLDAQ